MSTGPQRPLPESYRRLNEFAARFAAGSVVYALEQVPDRFFVVLSGTVRLDRSDGKNGLVPAGKAVRGQLFGHLAAFEGRPPLTVATTEDDAVLIVVPIAQAKQAFALSPDLAIEVARDLAGRVPAEVASEIPEQLPDPMPAPVARKAGAIDVEDEPSTEAEPEAPAAAATGESRESRGDGWDPALTKLNVEFDESFFFRDTIDCPACGSRFEYLRVRTAGVRPQHRDTDFYVTYRSEDPIRYGIVVCATCSYAAMHDDFKTLAEDERKKIVAARQARGRYDYPNLGGPRTLEESLTALELAQACYQLRAPSERRDAVLFHRRAWIERERGDAAAEREWLEKARDAYRRSFELDGEISEEAAMRVAYLIGDLSLRLDEPVLGAQWLETATRFPGAKQQSGLERQARDRLSDARALLAELESRQKSA
jgi:hypothetical protein